MSGQSAASQEETPAAADVDSGAWPKLWKEFRHADNIKALVYTSPDHEITKSLDENNFDREPFIYWRDYNTTGARYGPGGTEKSTRSTDSGRLAACRIQHAE